MYLEKAVEALQKDIVSLHSIAERFENQDHVFIEAINRINDRLDDLTQKIHSLERKKESDWMI